MFKATLIDEAIVKLMELAGATTQAGWTFSEVKSYRENLKSAVELFAANIEGAIGARYCQKCLRPLIFQEDDVPCYRCDPCELLWPAENIALFSLSITDAEQKRIYDRLLNVRKFPATPKTGEVTFSSAEVLMAVNGSGKFSGDTRP